MEILPRHSFLDALHSASPIIPLPKGGKPLGGDGAAAPAPPRRASVFRAFEVDFHKHGRTMTVSLFIMSRKRWFRCDHSARADLRVLDLGALILAVGLAEGDDE